MLPDSTSSDRWAASGVANPTPLTTPLNESPSSTTIFQPIVECWTTDENALVLVRLSPLPRGVVVFVVKAFILKSTMEI